MSIGELLRIVYYFVDSIGGVFLASQRSTLSGIAASGRLPRTSAANKNNELFRNGRI
ncbi:hypothetical protein LMIY3S_00512 [Labrys miyagiensis]